MRFVHTLTRDADAIATGAPRALTPRELNARNRQRYARDMETLQPRGNLIATLPKERYAVEETDDGWRVFDLANGAGAEDDAENLRQIALATGAPDPTTEDRRTAHDESLSMPERLRAMNRVNRRMAK